jgi:hypothetical protein
MRIGCRLFGHEYRRATTGLTGVNGKAVFRCHCGTEWITAEGWGDVRPTKRDRFT